MAAKFIPYFESRKNRWRVTFPPNIIAPSATRRSFHTEEDARKFVLEIIPDAYDIKIETEKQCKECKHILPVEEFHLKYKNIRERLCKSCRAKQQKIIRINKYNKNICKDCSDTRLTNSSYCYKHWFTSIAYKYFKRSEDIYLINLYEKQNRRCVYTGVLLIPSENMSLDHIVSRNDNPELTNDINNVQWVHKDINMMKTRFSHDVFIKLCKHIAKRF